MLFCTAFGIAYGIQLLFVILMIEAIGIKEFTAQFIGIIIYGAVNFMVNNRITFR
jgi:putative flippase GtrA